MNSGPILVLGAAGLLGRALIKASDKARRITVGLSRTDCDVTDGAAIERALDAYRPRLVVNASAYTDVDGAETERATAVAVNATGPENIARAAAQTAVPVVHVSTDCVFDGTGRRPYREDDNVAPLGVYGQSKADGEARLRTVQPEHVILRTAWLFGEHGRGFVQFAIASVLAGRSIQAITDQTGSPTAAIDLAEAILAVSRAIDDGSVSWGTYHYAGDDPATRMEVAKAVFEAAGALGRQVPEIVPVELADFPAAARRPKYSALDSSRFVRTFAFPASDWKNRVARLVEAEATRMELPTA